MDQMKKLLSVLRKHNFWLLAMLVVTLASIGFWISRGSLRDSIDRRAIDIESANKATQEIIKNVSSHPNSYSHEKMDTAITALSNTVMTTWQAQFDRQKSILVWPKDVLLDETRRKLQEFFPIETKLEFPLLEEPLTGSERGVYRDYISNVFPELAAIIGAEWTAELKRRSSSGGGFGQPATSSDNGNFGPGGQGPFAVIKPPEKLPTVIWDRASQEKLLSKICGWYNPDIAPKTLEICYTQEDIWVLKGILQIIKATNGDVRENFLAPVKKIEWIRIGQNAMGTVGDISPIRMSSSAPVVGPEGLTSSAGTSTTPGLGSASNSSLGLEVMEGDPADMRYVDANFQPIKGVDLRAKMKSSEPADAFYVVAKRIPVRIRLVVDQKHKNRLLAACGDGDGRFVLEVRQVRINANAAAEGVVTTVTTTRASNDSGGGGGQPGGGQPSGQPSDGDGGENNNSGGMGAYGNSSPLITMPEAKVDVDLEIYGVIYIYNPVEFEKLGLEKVNAETQLETTIEDENASKKPEVPADKPRVIPADASTRSLLPVPSGPALTLISKNHRSV